MLPIASHDAPVVKSVTHPGPTVKVNVGGGPFFG